MIASEKCRRREDHPYNVTSNQCIGELTYNIRWYIWDICIIGAEIRPPQKNHLFVFCWLWDLLAIWLSKGKSKQIWKGLPIARPKNGIVDGT